MPVDVCASIASALQYAYKIVLCMYYTDIYMRWFGPTSDHFSKDIEVNDFYFRQWEKCILQKGDIRYFSGQELQHLTKYGKKLKWFDIPISDNVWQLCLNALTTPYVQLPSYWLYIMPKFHVVRPDRYHIPMELWDFIFHIAVQRNQTTRDAILGIPIPDKVVEQWVLLYPTDYFSCATFGNQRYTQLSPNDIKNEQTQKYLKAIINSIQWDLEDMNPLYKFILTVCNDAEPMNKLFLFQLSELDHIIGVLRPTSNIVAWKTVYRMCSLTKQNSAHDNTALVDMLTQTPETDIHQEWFSYASSILLWLRQLSIDPSQGFSMERYKTVCQCHDKLCMQDIRTLGFA
jgi:hypothetical protein